MTQIVPLVMYKGDQRLVIGKAEIDGDEVRGEISNKEVADLFRQREPVGHFSLVAEPAMEKLKDLKIVVDERVPPGEIRFVNPVDEDFETNPVKLLLEKKTLIPPKEKGQDA